MSKLLSLTWHKVLPVEFSLSGKLATQLGSSTGQSGLVASNSTKLTRSWMSSQSSLSSLSSLQNVAMKVFAIAEPSAKKSLLCWVLMLSPVLQTFKRLHCATDWTVDMAFSTSVPPEQWHCTSPKTNKKWQFLFRRIDAGTKCRCTSWANGIVVKLQCTGKKEFCTE